MAFDRRALFVGAALGALAACGGGEPEANLVTLGDIGEVRQRASEGGDAFPVPENRAWVVRMPGSTAEADGGGLPAISQKCPEDGRRVVFCAESGLFECPCCRSQFDVTGAYRSGVAPRGLDLHPLRVDNDVVVADFAGLLRGGPRPNDVETPASVLTCL